MKSVEDSLVIWNAGLIWMHDKKDAGTAELERARKHGKTILTATSDRRWGSNIQTRILIMKVRWRRQSKYQAASRISDKIRVCMCSKTSKISERHIQLYTIIHIICFLLCIRHLVIITWSAVRCHSFEDFVVRFNSYRNRFTRTVQQQRMQLT